MRPAPKRLVVWLYGHPIAIVEQDGQRRVRLYYAPPSGGPADRLRLSVSMPRADPQHGHAVVDGFLANLLPDRTQVLDRWRAAYGITDRTPFGLVARVGSDVAGAARFLPEDVAGDGQPPVFEPLTDHEVAERLDQVVADQPTDVDGVHHGQFSLAGAQAKLALHRDEQGTWGAAGGGLPTTHILKPAIPTMPDQDIDEHLTMTAARLAGLATATTDVVEFAGRRVLVVTRFDRRRTDDGQWVRIHQEDFCQVLGAGPDRKYEVQQGPGVRRIGDVLREQSGAARATAEVTRFADALVFNWIVLGTDAHAKNYAVLHAADDPRVRLAPLYDLNSFLPYARPGRRRELSMRIGGVTYDADAVDRFTWASCARDLGLPPELLAGRIDHLLDVVPEAMAQAAGDPRVTRWDSTLPARLVDAVADRAHGLRAAL